MKHVLVTGGAGYVGSHVCKALAAAGHVPVTFDNLSQGHEWAVRWGPLVLGDLQDRSALDAAFKAYVESPLATKLFNASVVWVVGGVILIGVVYAWNAEREKKWCQEKPGRTLEDLKKAREERLALTKNQDGKQ